jgi:hypothetical protein
MITTAITKQLFECGTESVESKVMALAATCKPPHVKVRAVNKVYADTIRELMRERIIPVKLPFSGCKLKRRTIVKETMRM